MWGKAATRDGLAGSGPWRLLWCRHVPSASSRSPGRLFPFLGILSKDCGDYACVCFSKFIPGFILQGAPCSLTPVGHLGPFAVVSPEAPPASVSPLSEATASSCSSVHGVTGSWGSGPWDGPLAPPGFPGRICGSLVPRSGTAHSQCEFWGPLTP